MSTLRPQVLSLAARRASLRDRIAAALARRPARERWALDLLLLEGLRPSEVAHAVNVSPRQVERTYLDFMAECARLMRAGARSRTRRVLKKAA